MNLHHLLPNHPWSDRIHYFDCIPSTNLTLQTLAQNGAPEGTVVIADTQSSGMGRLGRSFHSPAGAGIYMSVLLRPACRPEELMHLTCAVAVAVHQAIERTTGIRVQIKWVNDLLWQDRKLAGILTKLSIDPKTGLVDWAIVGIGINCTPAAFPPELEGIVTSLSHIGNAPMNRESLAAELIRRISAMAADLFTQRKAVMAYYRQNCAFIGEKVWLIHGDARTGARVLDVDDWGGLVVQGDDDRTWTVNSGEISLRRQISSGEI